MKRMQLTGTRPKSRWGGLPGWAVQEVLTNEFLNTAHRIKNADREGRPLEVANGKAYFRGLLKEYAQLPHAVRRKRCPKGTWGESLAFAYLTGFTYGRSSRCVRLPRWMWGALRKNGVV